jgi:hypothetical protein
MEGYTVFISYSLISLSGYTQAIHCNYIKSIQLDVGSPYLQQINIKFSSINDFKFLNDNITGSTGFTAQKIQILIQLVNNSGYTSISDVKPNSSQWKIFDVTNQTSGYISGQTLTKLGITSTIYKVSLFNYDSMQSYNLNYLNYPTTGTTDNNKLCFGDEIYFLGNVTTEIHADVYVTDLSINLPLNEFNSTTNPTWDGVSSVAITEIGIYDDNYNLVAIGKLNDPITKDSTISRTIAFAIDF